MCAPSPRVGEGGRGDEGQTRTGMPAHPSQRGARASGAHWRNARAPGAHLRCARLRRIPRQRRSSPAGASTRSGRASARTLSRFRHQDTHTPSFSPCGRRGQGGMRGKRARECPRIPPSEVRAPPARTGATPALPAHTSGARASGAYPGRDAPAPQGLLRAQGGLQPAPSPVSGIRTPRLPLLPVWKKGAGGDEGQTRTGMGSGTASTSLLHDLRRQNIHAQRCRARREDRPDPCYVHFPADIASGIAAWRWLRWKDAADQQLHALPWRQRDGASPCCAGTKWPNTTPALRTVA
jgi:hypothetical protein